MICLSTSFKLHSGLSGNSLAGKGASSYVNLFILTCPLTFVFRDKIFFKVIVFIFHLCGEHNRVTSRQHIILCGWHIFCCCDIDVDDDDDDDSDNNDDDVTLTVRYCILVLSGPQSPVQHMVLQCMMGSCGYLLVMMGMLDSMICGPSHCW